MLSRRRFLRHVVALGGALTATSVLAACAPTAAPSKPAEPAKPTAAPAKPTEAPKPEAKPAAQPTAAAKPAEAAKPAAPAATQAAPAGRTVLTWGASDFPVRLNPLYTTNTVTTEVYDNIYDTLARRDPDLKLIPGLATEWKLLNDTTWQFKLRPNVKFHNGDPFTAADVKFTIERTYDPEAKSIHSTVFAGVQSVDVVDDLTVNFVMKAPDPLLPARTAYYGGYIMPAKYWRQVGDDGFERQPVGTGPFKVVEYTKDDHMTFDANKEYWGGAPNVDGLLLLPRPDASARVAALIKGDVQFIDRIPDDQVDILNAGADTKAVSVPLAGVAFVQLNTTKPPLDNKQVRQAMNIAIDREALVKELLYGRAPVANGPVPNGEFGNPGTPPPPFDPQRAKALLGQSGYKGEELLFEFLDTERNYCEAVGAMWSDIGLNVKLQVLEGSVRSQKIASRAFTGGFGAAFVSTLQDPAGLMWRSAGPGGILSAYWTNEEWLRLGRENETLLDQEKRRANFHRMFEIMMDELPWMVLFQLPLKYAMKKNIEWRPHPNFMVDFRKDNLTVRR